MKTFVSIYTIVFSLMVLTIIASIENSAYAAPKSVIDLRADPALPEKFNKQIRKSLEQVLRFYEHGGWTPKNPLVVTISKNPEFHVNFRHGSKTKTPFDQGLFNFAKRQCATNRPAVGWANPKALHICFNKNLNVTKKFSSKMRFGIGASMAHEIRHVNQFDLASLKMEKNGNWHWFGPAWLVEGDANLFEMEYIKKEHGWQANIGEWVIEKAKESKKNRKLTDYNT